MSELSPAKAATVSPAEQFKADSAAKSFDLKHRKTLRNNMGKYADAVERGLTQYEAHAVAREHMAQTKDIALHQLDEMLLQFEAKIKKRGAEVLWATDAAEALQLIAGIMRDNRAKMIVKSKSMTTEELHLNDFLAQQGVEPVETDLGEYIVQLIDQPPYHIVTPCMHLSKEEIGQIFHEKLNIAYTSDPQTLVAVARKLLREKYTTADVGITGANFIIAETGSIALTENEGNARMSVTFPKVHIVIAGIEKVLPRLDDLSLFWPMLATHGTGQRMTVYNTIVSGPRQMNEVDGPEKMIVILLDNGRTNILADPQKRSSLRCIRCGACLNVCPVYRNIGGHSYGSTYSGPIGSVITPHLQDLDEYKHLSYASSLCGACTEVCPVKIDLAHLLLLNRKEAVDKGLTARSERQAITLWKMAMKHRFLYKWLVKTPPAGLKSLAFNKLFAQSWGSQHSPLKLAPKSFSELWSHRKKSLGQS